MVYIGAGFKTDGASVPKEELEDSKLAKEICKLIAKHYQGKNYKETLAYLIGTPFEMPRLLAAIVHDALYSYKWKIRWICDLIYRRILCIQKYDSARTTIEYAGIRIIGWKNWNSVTDFERDRTRKIVKIKFIRNKKIQEEIDKMRILDMDENTIRRKK
jgi:hypothetical protein